MSTSSHDRSEITEVAGQVAGATELAVADRETMQRGLDGQEASFGSDAAAQAFLSGYAPNARTVLENTAQIATQLEAIAQRLSETGGIYTRGEQEAVDLGRGVDQELQA